MNVKKHSSGSRDEVGYVSTVAEFAEDCVARAHMLISSFIEGEEDEHGKRGKRV